MGKHTQAAKRHKQSLKRKVRNYAYRSRLRTYIKSAREAIAAKGDDREELVMRACRQLDRMVTRGVIHKNTASRRKSRLLGALRGKTGPMPPVQPAASEPVPGQAEGAESEINEE